MANHSITSGETSPLLRHQDQEDHDLNESRIDGPNEEQTHQRWWTYCHPKLPISVPLATTTLVPLLGILTVFTNEAEFYVKSPAQLRAIEALCCLEYYRKINDPIANLGRSIPELMCKGREIQERVAVLNGALFTIRMTCAVSTLR